MQPLYLWAAAVILGFPLLTFALGEAVRRLAPTRPETASWLRVVQNVLLPVAACWVILQKIAGLPEEWLLRPVVDTVFAAVLIHVALGIVQLLLLANAGLAARAPKLLIDLGRLMLVAFGVAVVVSEVWDVDLGSLVAALGVGSVVLGLAMQGVIGGLVHGIILLSGRHFAIGDVLKVGEATGRVAQVDWLAVTIEDEGRRTVIPSGDLAQTGFAVLGPEANPWRAHVVLELGYAHPPERVRAALLRAAAGLPQLRPGQAPACRVAGYGDRGLRYEVTLPLASALDAPAAEDELLSRFWYVAQREGIGLAPEPPPDGPPPDAVAARAAILAGNGTLGLPGLPLSELAAIARHERYRPGEALLEETACPAALYALVEGEVAVTAAPEGGGGVALPVQRLAPGDLLAAREAFRGERSRTRAEAVGEVAVLALPVPALLPLLGRNPALARIVELALEAQEEAVEKVRHLRRAREAAKGRAA